MNESSETSSLGSPGRRTTGVVGLLAILGLIGLVGVAIRLIQLETELVQAIALDDAERFATSLKEFRTLYSSEVVERAQEYGMTITHDYQSREDSLPLPVTLTMLLGSHLSEVDGGSVRLYSEYPFKGGQNHGVDLDSFERDALKTLQENTTDTYYNFEETSSGTVLRFATADVMRPSCVECHNTHPLSPKTDWEVGDVRGVLALTVPMSDRALQTRSDIRFTVWAWLGVVVLTLGVIGLAAIRLRRASLELDRETIKRQKAQDARAVIEAQALQMQKLESLGLLAGGIAHDFNNLLVSILGNAELASFQIDKDSPAMAYLEVVQKGGLKAANLTNQLLAYAGHQNLEIHVLDMNQTVRGIGQLLHTAVARKVRVVYELGPDLPAIEADPSQLEQVIVNLLTNASDALSGLDGNVTIRTGVEQVEIGTQWTGIHGESQPVGCYVFLEVQDTGSGMDRATCAQIFDPFYTTKGKGRGLGLAAIQGILRAHGGSIRVRSVLGEGTTIRVIWPCSPLAVDELSTEDMPVLYQGSGQLILVVDDDEDVLNTTAGLIRSRGFETRTAATGLAALSLLRENLDRVHGVVLDMSMPGMGGIEVFEDMMALRPDLNVVIVSGFTQEERLQELISSGRIHFFCKPFSLEDLACALLKSRDASSV